MNQHELVYDKTVRVRQYLHKVDETYDKVKSMGEKPDFFEVVEPFVNEVHRCVDEWNQLAKEWVHSHRPKNLYGQQIDAATENMKEVCVQAFDPKTSLRRFKHHIHSVQYVLEKLSAEIKNRVD